MAKKTLAQDAKANVVGAAKTGAVEARNITGEALGAAAAAAAEVVLNRIAQALSQYVRSLVSGDSRYDRAIAAGSPTNLVGLTTEEKLGEQLFRSQKCSTCHVTTAQVGDAPHNVGLDAVDTDPGVAGVGTGRFKSPSLRV